MIKKLHVLFFSLLFTFVFSQSYTPFLNNSKWNITVANFGGPYNLVINEGVDVVVGAYTYKKFVDPFFNNEVYIREDVASKRVYRLVNSVDQLLYDFNLQVSDMITLSNGITYTVTSITDVTVNGGTRKKYNLYNFAGGETWIEGVGSNRHPLLPSYELPSDPYVYMTCSSQNGQDIYNHGLANGATPTDCSMLSTDDYHLNGKNIVFYPNPFQQEVTITSETRLQNAKLRLFNSLGQLIKLIENINGNSFTMNRENLNDGIYLFELMENSKVITKSKIIIKN